MTSTRWVNRDRGGAARRSPLSSESSFTSSRSTRDTLVTSTSWSRLRAAPLVSSRAALRPALVTLAVAVALFAPLMSASSARAAASSAPVATVWTEPEAGYGFLDPAINGAHRSIDVSMYELSDPVIEHDLVA